MDLQFDDQEVAFAESASRFLKEEWPFSKREAIIESPDGFSREQWAAFADLGWLSLSLPEEHGGLGLGPAYLYLLMEQFGRALVNSPYVSTVVVGAAAIEQASDETLKAELLPQIAAGKLLIAFANEEPSNRRSPLNIATAVRSEGDGFVLSGQKSAVQFAHVADRLIVSARLSGKPEDRDGIGLFLVERDAPGIALRTFVTHDGGRASELTLSDVRVGKASALGAPGAAGPLLENLIDRGAAALAIDSMGAMWAVQEQTLAYLNAREQFGVKLASFQELQHRLVDIFIKCELARSLALDASWALADAGQPQARKRISAAKYRIGTEACEVGKDGVHLHGGVGVTKEFAVGHYLKRAMVQNLIYGDAAWHFARYQSIMMERNDTGPPTG
ncbi:MAG: acyl-CoA dehydrogenase family protein [Pseudorhodoplanes sp.]